MIAYSPVRALAQRMVAALVAIGSSTETLNGAKAINRKIQGRRKTKVKEPPAPNPSENPTDASLITQTDKQISASQKSYDNLTANFSTFIELLKGQSEYQPHETELQTATLTSFLNTLKEKNGAVVAAYTTWSNSRIYRDKIMYGKSTGITDIAQQVKN